MVEWSWRGEWPGRPWAVGTRPGLDGEMCAGQLMDEDWPSTKHVTFDLTKAGLKCLAGNSTSWGAKSSLGHITSAVFLSLSLTRYNSILLIYLNINCNAIDYATRSVRCQHTVLSVQHLSLTKHFTYSTSTRRYRDVMKVTA